MFNQDWTQGGTNDMSALRNSECMVDFVTCKVRSQNKVQVYEVSIVFQRDI